MENHKEKNTRKDSSIFTYFRRRIKPNIILYIFLIPVLIYAVIFWYIPMAGNLMAFQNYSPRKGFFHSSWVGFDHFKRFFDSYMFVNLIRNTLVLSIYSFLAGLPIPIILALAFQYHQSKKYVHVVQTTTYAPHFISVVVLTGMLRIFLSRRTGLVNHVIRFFDGEAIDFLSRGDMFSHIYVWSGIWQGAGWSSIIYTAALSNSDPLLHEAAIVDGASIWKRIIYIDIPTIAPVFVILQILAVGNILGVGFEKIYLMQNPSNIMVSEVISTYVYKLGVLGGEVSYTTAIGLFNNIVNFCLLLIANTIVTRFSDTSVI